VACDGNVPGEVCQVCQLWQWGWLADLQVMACAGAFVVTETAHVWRGIRREILRPFGAWRPAAGASNAWC